MSLIHLFTYKTLKRLAIATIDCIWFDSLIHLQDSQTALNRDDVNLWFDSLIHLQDSQTINHKIYVKKQFDSLIHLQDSQTINVEDPPEWLV